MENGEIKEIIKKTPRAASMILGPQGECLCNPLVGKEERITAEIDVSRSIEHKQVHDIIGYYNRFDIFRFELDEFPKRPLWLRDVPVRKIKDGNKRGLTKRALKSYRTTFEGQVGWGKSSGWGPPSLNLSV